MRFQPGDTVGPYRVTGAIGEGATGVVYQVVNSVTGRLEAVKILADSFTGDREQAQRFLREIQLQAKLDHPNIAQVRTAFCEGTTIVLVMELVDGESLGSVLRRGPLSVSGAIRVAEQVLNALIMAHHHGVVHRDVKPANILVDCAGNVKLTDFGLAKQFGEPGQTAQGMAVGTVFYMAPEQVRGLAATDWRADLYAVGVLLYEMLTGRKPFDGAEQYAVMRAHVELTPPPVSHWAPHLPKEFDSLIERALQKDPAKRFQSASGFLTALQELPLTAATPAKAPWQYATYAAGLGTLILAAFALPPTIADQPLESIPLTMPAPPSVPPEALRPAPAPPVEPAVETAREPAPPAPPAVRPSARRVVPFSATRIISTERPENPDPPPPINKAETSLLAPPKLNITEPPPKVPAVAPSVQPELPTEKPKNWMRRNLGRVPKIFRRGASEPGPKP
ncbi:MAG: serine/threonine protein kinase [Bryobacterales bacterium]|nr:serine/threonine protein kinase [Bryobacterales bacterium]